MYVTNKLLLLLGRSVQRKNVQVTKLHALEIAPNRAGVSSCGRLNCMFFYLFSSEYVVLLSLIVISHKTLFCFRMAMF